MEWARHNKVPMLKVNCLPDAEGISLAVLRLTDLMEQLKNEYRFFTE